MKIELNLIEAIGLVTIQKEIKTVVYCSILINIHKYSSGICLAIIPLFAIGQ